MLWLASILAIALLGAEDCFVIQVVDAQTQRGVPLVELRTVNEISYWTDSQGIVALREPELEGQNVFFNVESHGYEFPADGFGIRGQALLVERGKSATLKINRVNIAQRLYRITGGGIYRDSVMAGRSVPIEHPLLNALVIGSDSVEQVAYRGKLYWFWGDTLRHGYPLGNFHVPGATSDLPGQGGLDPGAGINLSYFLDAPGDETPSTKGFAKGTAKMPGEGPTWIQAVTVVPDAAGKEQMYAGYIKVKPPLEVYARGLARFNSDKQAFEKVADVSMDAPIMPDGYAFRHREGDVDYVYFAKPYALTRVRATAEEYLQPSHYEAWTCLKPGSRMEQPSLDRDDQGRVRYAWKRDTPAVGPAEQATLIKNGLLKESEAWLKLRDTATGKPVVLHNGTVAWNAYRQRWISIAVQHYGSSLLGEMWYSEAPAPHGPFAKAVKIVTHNDYSFYNPRQHPVFDQEGGRLIYFEGTYTRTFSGNKRPTPRYEYNQMMYRLDLGDPRLK